MRDKKNIFRTFQELFEKLAPSGLLPPQALDVEESLLGSCMLSPEARDTAYRIIGERTVENSCFYKTAHTYIWRAITAVMAANEQADMLTVVNELNKQGLLAEAGGTQAIVHLTSSIVTTSHIEAHARIIVEKWIAREGIRVAEMLKLRFFEGTEDTFELVDRSVDELMSLSSVRSAGVGPKKVSDRVRAVIAHIENAGKGELPGLGTGLQQIDTATLGLGYGSQTVLAALPSQGKSALSGYIGLNAAKRGDGVVIFSQEMKDINIYLRMLASETLISQHSLRGGLKNGSTEDWKSVTTTMYQLGTMPLWIDDSRKLTPTQIRTRLRQITRSNDIKLVIVDYLQLMLPSAKTESRNLDVASISGDLFALWGDVGCAGLVLSQFSRPDSNARIPNKPAPRPKLWDLRDSGSVEQDADDVYFIYHPRSHTPGYADRRKVIVELMRAKARGGPTGSFFLVFDKPTQSFQECPPAYQSEDYEAYVDRLEQEFTGHTPIQQTQQPAF